MKAKLVLLLLIIVGIASPLDENVSAQETSVLPITAIAWSPDESKIALSRSNCVVEIWDVETNQLIVSVNHNNPVTNSIAWSPDGKQVASSSGYEVDVWDVKTGNLLSILQHDGRVLSLIYTLDNEQIISVDFDSPQNLYIWDIAHESIIAREDTGSMVDMDWSPNGNILALANATGTIVLEAYEESSFSYIKYFEHPEIIGLTSVNGFDNYAIDWKSDGSQIASGSLNGKVRVWDVKTGEIILDLKGNDNEASEYDRNDIRDIGFSTDGERLYSISADGTIRVWDTGNGEIIRTIALDKAVRSADFNQERSLVAVGYQSGEFALIATEPEID